MKIVEWIPNQIVLLTTACHIVIHHFSSLVAMVWIGHGIEFFFGNWEMVLHETMAGQPMQKSTILTKMKGKHDNFFQIIKQNILWHWYSLNKMRERERKCTQIHVCTFYIIIHAGEIFHEQHVVFFCFIKVIAYYIHMPLLLLLSPLLFHFFLLPFSPRS